MLNDHLAFSQGFQPSRLSLGLRHGARCFTGSATLEIPPESSLLPSLLSSFRHWPFYLNCRNRPFHFDIYFPSTATQPSICWAVRPVVSATPTMAYIANHIARSLASFHTIQHHQLVLFDRESTRSTRYVGVHGTHRYHDRQKHVVLKYLYPGS